MEKILEPILNSPRLKDYVAELQDYLSSEEERRNFFYNKITDKDKAEFINGEIILHSPVVLVHNVVLKHLLFVIDKYVTFNNLGLVGYEKLMVRLTRNDYEPDLCFFSNEKAEAFLPNQKLFPVPDFVVEVLSESTSKNDRGVKMEDYALHGVKEYWLIEPARQFVEQYYLKHNSFFLHKMYGEGDVIQSDVIRGLQFPVEAIFNEKANNAYLKQFF